MSEIYDLTREFNQDKRLDKINATIGVIIKDDGKPYVMDCVKQAIKSLSYCNFNYLPIAGDANYLKAVKEFLGLYDYKIQGTCGGTNALYLWVQLQKDKRIIIMEPTWENHYQIFSDYEIKNLLTSTFDELKETLKAYSEVTVLYQIVDNPTGNYFKIDQWKELSKFSNPVLFDVPYLGLGEGLKEDLYPIKLFKDKDMSVAISFSKIMTLYQHRVGALLTKRDWDMEGLFRKVNSTPPAFGELIVADVLRNNYFEWRNQLNRIREMIDRRREVFKIDGFGLYSLLPYNKRYIEKLKKDHGIYLLSNGRINFGGITLKQAEKIKEVLCLNG